MKKKDLIMNYMEKKNRKRNYALAIVTIILVIYTLSNGINKYSLMAAISFCIFVFLFEKKPLLGDILYLILSVVVTILAIVELILVI